jgi:hypothetical protein
VEYIYSARAESVKIKLLCRNREDVPIHISLESRPCAIYTIIQLNIYHVEIIFMKLVFIKQAVPEINAESPLANTS